MTTTLRLILFSASLALAHAAAPSACAESVPDASLNTPEGNTSVAIEAPVASPQTPTPKPNAPVGPPPDPGKHPTDQTNVGDPVGVVSGAASSSAVDVVVRCPGIDLVFQRVYNGSLATSSALGHRWTHSYDWRLVPYASGDWMVLTAMADPARVGGASALHHFERFEDGTYSMSDADQYVLVKNPDGTYRVRTPGGRAYLFGSDGVLDAIEHISGARVSLTYENRSGPGARRLTRVEHVNKILGSVP